MITVKNATIKDFLISWPTNQKSKWSDLLLIGPSMIAWHLWKERNRIIYKESSLPTDRLIDKIKRAIEEVINGKISKDTNDI